MRLLYRGLTGSQLHGTATPKSDTDYVEVYLPTLEQIFGLGEKQSKLTQTLGEKDISRFNVNQYMRLLSKGNPNVLETLFCPIDRIEWRTPAFRRLVGPAHNDVAGLLHKESIVRAHLGFAIQQCHKMLPAKAKWAGPRREVLFEKYGYDVKYAAHAIRLVRQCRELLQTGYIVYPYQNNLITILSEIREGKWGLTAVRKMFAHELEEVQEIEDGDCAINNEDKTDKINERLIRFYQEIGYAC